METNPLLTTTEAVLAQLNFIRNKKQEYCICLSIDSGNRLITRRVVTIGTLTQSLIHPREVFAGPLKDRVASVIIVHNHPSGEAAPSGDDIKTTQQLVAAGQIIGIPLHDHVIATAREHYSLRNHFMI